MDRRNFLTRAAPSLLCPVCVALASGPVFAAGGKPHWSYNGKDGPANRGKLGADYSACGIGSRQSPVDLRAARAANIAVPKIQWQPIKLGTIVNNGHTIQVNTPDAGHIEKDGARYQLVQFHFHHRSEDTVAGHRFAMEVHFVHQADEGDGLAVIGVFFAEGPENPLLKPIWAAAPKDQGKASSDAVIDAREFLPASPARFEYAGSLTTPRCSEIVAWTGFKEPIGASAEQIAAFGKLFTNNYRPLQPLNRRFILFGG